MNVSTRALLTLVVAMFVSITAANAQPRANIAPNGQFGIGINTEGGSVQYAISPSIFVLLDVAVDGVSVTGDSRTAFGIGPAVRFLFEGALNPFVQAGVRILNDSRTQTNTGGTEVKSSSSEMDLYAGFGLEYFASNQVGLFSQIDFLQLQLSGSNEVGGVSADVTEKATRFGLVGGRAGVEFFFSR